MSVELQPSWVYDPERHAASQTELHAIYNRHVSKKDAKRTLDKIPTDSIVYLEGLKIETIPDNDLIILAEHLGRYLRLNGKDKNYRKGRNTVVKEFLTGSDKKTYDNFLYASLLERDCQIVHADYGHITSPEYQREINIVNDHFSMWHETEINTGKGIGICCDAKKYFDDLADLVQRRWQLIEVREECATDVITQDLADLALYQHIDDAVPMSESGKMKAFLIYGASHKYSLTSRLTNTGIEVITYDVSNANGGMYVHEPYEKMQENYMRTIAFTAFLATTWKMANLPSGKDEDDAPMTEIHESLTRLNGDDEATLEFCSRCLKIQKQADKHPKKSLKAYWKLVEDYNVA